MITTYRRFFEAESAYLSICQQNTGCSLYLATITFQHHEWWHIFLGNFKRAENERHSSENIDSLRKPAVRIFQLSALYENANVPVTITLRARAILTNHGLRRCPWNVHTPRERGGSRGGTKIKYPGPNALARSGANDVAQCENKDGSNYFRTTVSLPKATKIIDLESFKLFTGYAFCTRPNPWADLWSPSADLVNHKMVDDLTNLQWFSVVWTLIYHDLRQYI